MTKEMVLETLSRILPTLILYVGLLAIVVSVIVEGLKNLPRFRDVPTKLVVYGTAAILTPLSYVALCAWMAKPVEWYMVFANMIAAFFIAKVSMSGWDDLMELITRCMPGGIDKGLPHGQGGP